MSTTSGTPGYPTWVDLNAAQRRRYRVRAHVALVTADRAAREFLQRYSLTTNDEFDASVAIHPQDRMEFLERILGSLERSSHRLDNLAIRMTARSNWNARASIGSALFHLDVLHNAKMEISRPMRRQFAAPYGPLEGSAEGYERPVSSTAFQPSYAAFRARVGNVPLLGETDFRRFGDAVFRVYEVLAYFDSGRRREAITLASSLVPLLQTPTAMYALMRDPVLLDAVASGYNDPQLHEELWPAAKARDQERNLYRALSFSREFKDIEPLTIDRRWPATKEVDLAL